MGSESVAYWHRRFWLIQRLARGRLTPEEFAALDERIRRLMQDLSAIHPEMTAALENAIWLRYGIDL